MNIYCPKEVKGLGLTDDEGQRLACPDLFGGQVNRNAGIHEGT
jgi:hypothetical protein